MQAESILHPIPPLYTKDSRILILGSFPSVKSRETGFFYGHPRNRFWSVLGSVFEDAVPGTVPEKKEFLLRHGIAVWDVIRSCTIAGSSDASIKDVVPNDIRLILETDLCEWPHCGEAVQKIYRGSDGAGCRVSALYEPYECCVEPGAPGGGVVSDTG